MSKHADEKVMSDLEKELEEEMKGRKFPEEGRLPEQSESEREHDKEKELNPFAERFYKLSGRNFKTETELDSEINGILNEIERDYFFKGLLEKTKKGGKLLLKKGLETFKGVSALQATMRITQLARGNLKGNLCTLAKASLRETGVGGTVFPVLGALGFKTGEQNKDAWQNFANVCEESFDYLARNLNEKADYAVEANKLASEAFSAALEKVASSERKKTSVQRIGREAAKPVQNRVANRTLVIVLGLVCIILVAGLASALAVYVPMANSLQSQITEKDNSIATLKSQISALNNSLNQINASLSSKDTQIAALTSQLSELSSTLTSYMNILSLNETGYLVSGQSVSQVASANTTVYSDTLYYAGYVSVAVQSDSNTTYVKVAYSYKEVAYDNTATVGKSGTAAFPVLPTTVTIIVGNTELVNPVNATVTANYYY